MRTRSQKFIFTAFLKMKNVVFYSKQEKDIHSPELLKIFDMLPFKNEFEYYCVDPDKVTKKQNAELLRILEIEQVPTVIVNNEALVGDVAFRWARLQLRALMDDGEEADGYVEQDLEESQLEEEEDMAPELEEEQHMPEPARTPARGQQRAVAPTIVGYDAAGGGGGAAPFNSNHQGGSASTPRDVIDILRPRNTKMKGACEDVETRLQQYTQDRQDSQEVTEPPRRRRRR